uniref:Uncharacterized protein n=2 Tax=Pyricularia oryzae TaxID=318829 RepID=Q2KG67_PYRO7|nr:hypothetical protein MGCH7_ch7g468 [Pyricularia oryzae 70-15]
MPFSFRSAGILKIRGTVSRLLCCDIWECCQNIKESGNADK